MIVRINARWAGAAGVWLFLFLLASAPAFPAEQEKGVQPSAPATELPAGKKAPDDASGIKRLFERERLVTSGGLALKPSSDIELIPELGVGHLAKEREAGKGYDDTLHTVHAEAGGRISMYDRFYLGFATKLPVYNYENSQRRSDGVPTSRTTVGRHDYEILRLSPNNVNMSGEMGMRLGSRLDLNLFYDQNTVRSPSGSSGSRDEEMIGTRFIIRFE
jgi:hypothetical protein